MRFTRTNLDTLAEKEIQDIWYDKGPVTMSSKWIGSTVFDILRQKPKDGYTWVDGRETKIQKTTRPGNIRPEVWPNMSKADKQKAIANWETEGKAREEARSKRGLHHVPDEDKDYTKILADAQQKFGSPPVPAMPLISHGTALLSQGQPCAKREHQDHIAMSSYCSNEWYAMVHTPVPITKAYKIPDARKAIDKEWDKLTKKGAWDFSTVKPRKQVIAEAKRKGVSVQFGNFMELCHEKNSELRLIAKEFKGRLVFRGDQVRDETGYYAVFSEQGTSASRMAAANMLDALGRMPDCKV